MPNETTDRAIIVWDLDTLSHLEAELSELFFPFATNSSGQIGKQKPQRNAVLEDEQ